MTVAAAPARARIAHVPAADAVRVLTFACVIAVHTISVTHALDDPTADAAVMLLHFTREAFFVLTAFVLVHVHAARAPRATAFWRRRFLLVGVPYVVWTAIYTALQDPAEPLRSLALNLLTGTGWYHLYFLLVSLQFYLLFPLFRRLLVATRGHHRWVLAAALVAQVLVDLWIHDAAPPAWQAGSFVGSYVFFLVLGGVAALHREAVLGALRRRPWLVAAAVAATGVAAEAAYLAAVAAGTNPMIASDVFQPVMIPWVVAVVAAFALTGLWWGAPRWVTWASERSFGIFLVHPVFLWAVTGGWFALTGSPGLYADLPPPLPTVAVYLTAVVASCAAVELVRRTPLRLALTGKRKEER